MNLPKISVVTVCYNMENYIEETIQSIVMQEYPNLEYIIIDGGSTDKTLDIINKYKNKISILISEPDKGMYDAIDKGIRASTGEIVAWLNADDSYFAWTFKIVASLFQNNPDINWIDGINTFIDENRFLTNVSTHPGAKSQESIKNGWFRKEVYGSILQESMFWRRHLYFESGGLNTSYKYSGEFELWTRFAKFSDLVTVAIPLAGFMRRKKSISHEYRDLYTSEISRACQGKKLYPSFLWKLSSNEIYTHILRLFSFETTRLCFYSYKHQKFIVKSVYRSVSAYSFSEMRYNMIFNH